MLRRPLEMCFREQGNEHEFKDFSPALFCRLAAVCCAYYIAAQLLQEIIFHLGINDAASREKEILQRLMFLENPHFLRAS